MHSLTKQITVIENEKIAEKRLTDDPVYFDGQQQNIL